MSTDQPSPSSVHEQPLTPDVFEQVVQDLQAVNTQLLLAGMREHTLAEQLRRQLAFNVAITTSSGEGVYVLDSAGRCTFVNPAAEQVLGWTDAELRGQSVSVVLPPQVKHQASSDILPKSLLHVLRLGTIYRDEDAIFVHRDGSLLPMAYTAAPIMADGSIVGAVISFRDMTDVRQLQQIREEYVALISHDLRAPLTAMLGRAQILVRKLTEHGLVDQVGNASIIVEAGFRMDSMIEDLLNRSRTSANAWVRHRETVDLVKTIQDMLDQTVAPDERWRVTCAGLPVLMVVAEVAQIERVIVNLLTNALKFSAPQTPIHIDVSQQGSEAIIAITDHGAGIAAADLPHLFEKHYRVQTAQPVAGNGLGLYSSRLIMEAHGGRLWAASELGSGSTFSLALPLPTPID